MLGEGLDFMSEESFREVYESVIEAAARKNLKSVEGRLREQFSSHMSDARKFKANKNTLQAVANARAHGSMFDKKRGWDEFSVQAVIRFVGGPTREELVRQLKSQYGI
jgi:hypothetical protein